MLTVSSKGRLWTNLGMENAKRMRFLYGDLSSWNMLFFCCGKEQATTWANLLQFAMGRVQDWTVEQDSPLPSYKVSLALDVNCSCGVCLSHGQTQSWIGLCAGRGQALSSTRSPLESDGCSHIHVPMPHESGTFCSRTLTHFKVLLYPC